MFDQLSAEILASLIKGFPRTTTRTTTTTTTTKQNVDPAVHFVYSRVKKKIVGMLHHAVWTVLKKRPKPPILVIPFKNLKNLFLEILQVIFKSTVQS
jgi:hypothetical protein